jgi:hypothetical protein
VNSPATDKIDDLNGIPLVHLGVRVRGALDDDQVVLDRDATGIDAEHVEQRCQAERVLELVRLSVEANLHGT